MQPITPLGKRWEFAHSFWLLWLVVPFGFANYVSFFYIAARTKKRKWLVSGIVYFVIFVQYIHISDNYPIDHIYFDISMYITLFTWVISCIHAFLARREYLQLIAWKKEPATMKKIEKQRPIKQMSREEFEQIKQKVNQSIPKSNYPIQQSKIKNEKSLQSRSNKGHVFHINKVKQGELAKIVGTPSAKEIIERRKAIGDFQSMIHFIQEVNIEPHILVKMKQQIRFEVEENRKDTNPQQTPKSSTGRIVDY